jgi:hypothetical protein
MQIFIKHWIISIKIRWNVVQKKTNSNQFYSLFVIFMLSLLNVVNLGPSDGIGLLFLSSLIINFAFHFRRYPFNNGDLTISVDVLYNYLEGNSKVPWEDLRYLFGEIMYGGHITDDWDRRLCRNYLETYINPDMVNAIFHIFILNVCSVFSLMVIYI